MVLYSLVLLTKEKKSFIINDISLVSDSTRWFTTPLLPSTLNLTIIIIE